MDSIKTIINTFSAEDQREFLIFISRQKRNKKRKDQELFKILQTNQILKPSQIVNKLYPDKLNYKAYHALRRRLMNQLSDFVMLKQKEEDTSSASQILGVFSLAKYLFSKNSELLGWKFIKKAESLALLNEQFDLLNAIYNVQIEHADSQYADDLNQLIEKRNKNKFLADEDEKANIANSLITKSLKDVRLKGEAPDFSDIVDRIIEDYQIREAINKRPRLLFNLMSIARSAVLVKKDYHSFEPFVIEQFHKMEQGHGFSKAHHYYKLSLLYMISHVLYRNKKFNKSIEYLNLLSDDLNTYKKSYFELFIAKYALLMAANFSFLNKNSEAIKIIEELLLKRGEALSVQDYLNAKINLSFYYFQQKDYSKIAKELDSFSHSDKWYERKMGVEWVLRKNLSEMILQYELGNIDIMLNKIRNIERNYNYLFNTSQFHKVPTYLKLVKQLVQYPDSVTKETFFQKVNDAFIFLPIEQESIQEVNFYAWIKSKMVKKDYYEVLLEIINKES